MISPDLPSEDGRYERARITGTLRALSELHIGSGYEEEAPRARAMPAGETPALYSGLCLDAHGIPYLPASSLRGSLAQSLRGRIEKPRFDRIFGTARKAQDAAAPDEDHGQSGALRVADARAMGAGTARRSRTAIDAVTQTAAEHKLYTEQVVVEGTVFEVRLELGRVGAKAIETADVAAVLGALARLDGSGPALGAGKTHGRGRMRWRLAAGGVRALTHDGFRAWLRSGGALEDQFEIIEVAPRPLDIRAPERWLLLLVPEAPFLVNDAQEVARKEKIEGDPDLGFMRSGGRALVPGSTLKGLLRARCRRILLTMAATRHGVVRTNDVVNEMIKELFGHGERAGWVGVSDARRRYRKDRIHRQFFNAVDRFTGGVKKKALYNVEAVWPEALHCMVALSPEIEARPWTRGLLALALRDAMEGDLAFGWGKGKGYGAFRAEVCLSRSHRWVRHWRELLDADLEVGPLRNVICDAVRALEEEIAARLTQPSSTAAEAQRA